MTVIDLYELTIPALNFKEIYLKKKLKNTALGNLIEIEHS